MRTHRRAAHSDRTGAGRPRPLRRWGVVMVAAMAALVATSLSTTALGRAGGRTDEVMAELDFTRFDGAARFCAGEDGELDEERGVASGVSRGDARLSGRFEMHFRSLDRLADGHVGTVEGRFRVFDPATGQRKVEAEFHLVQSYGNQLGLIVGKVFDQRGISNLMANVRVGFMEENGVFDVVGQIGGQTDLGVLPAVIQTGGCTGPFVPYSFDLPASPG